MNYLNRCQSVSVGIDVSPESLKYFYVSDPSLGAEHKQTIKRRYLRGRTAALRATTPSRPAPFWAAATSLPNRKRIGRKRVVK